MIGQAQGVAAGIEDLEALGQYPVYVRFAFHLKRADRVNGT